MNHPTDKADAAMAAASEILGIFSYAGYSSITGMENDIIIHNERIKTIREIILRHTPKSSDTAEGALRQIAQRVSDAGMLVVVPATSNGNNLIFQLKTLAAHLAATPAGSAGEEKTL